MLGTLGSILPSLRQGRALSDRSATWIRDRHTFDRTCERTSAPGPDVRSQVHASARSGADVRVYQCDVRATGQRDRGRGMHPAGPLSTSPALQVSGRPQVCLTGAAWPASRLAGFCAERSLAVHSRAPDLLSGFRLKVCVSQVRQAGLRGTLARPAWGDSPALCTAAHCGSARLEAGPPWPRSL